MWGGGGGGMGVGGCVGGGGGGGGAKRRVSTTCMYLLSHTQHMHSCHHLHCCSWWSWVWRAVPAWLSVSHTKRRSYLRGTQGPAWRGKATQSIKHHGLQNEGWTEEGRGRFREGKRLGEGRKLGGGWEGGG